MKAHPELFAPADCDEGRGRRRSRVAIDDQVRAGLDRITDGEMQRVDLNLGPYRGSPRLERHAATPPLQFLGAALA